MSIASHKTQINEYKNSEQFNPSKNKKTSYQNEELIELDSQIGNQKLRIQQLRNKLKSTFKMLDYPICPKCGDKMFERKKWDPKTDKVTRTYHCLCGFAKMNQ